MVQFGMHDKYRDIRGLLQFEDVSDNFIKAAKFGVDSQFNWLGDKDWCLRFNIERIASSARHGLELQKVDTADIDKYLGIIEARATEHMTGARWQLRAFTKLKNTITRDEALAVLTSSIVNNQGKEIVHLWKLPDQLIWKNTNHPN
ncbi:MAG: hypothetical protein R2784_07645 [Saprospiraceae bacterium]